MSDRTYKKYDGEYVTIHDDGTRSVTRKDILGNYVTHHDNGGVSYTYKDMFIKDSSFL